MNEPKFHFRTKTGDSLLVVDWNSGFEDALAEQLLNRPTDADFVVKFLSPARREQWALYASKMSVTDPEVLRKLAKETNREVAESLIDHPRTTPDILTTLWDQYKEKDEWLGHKILTTPSCPPELKKQAWDNQALRDHYLGSVASNLTSDASDMQIAAQMLELPSPSKMLYGLLKDCGALERLNVQQTSIYLTATPRRLYGNQTGFTT